MGMDSRLGDEAAAVAQSANDEHGHVSVLDGERTKDGVTLDNLVLGDLMTRELVSRRTVQKEKPSQLTSTPSSFVSFWDRCSSMEPPPLVTQIKGNFSLVRLLPLRI